VFSVLNIHVDEALLLQSEIAKLCKPPRRTLEAVQTWFRTGSSRKDAQYNPILGGAATDFLANSQDLACLKAPQHSDALSRLLRRHWPVTVCIQNFGRDIHFATDIVSSKANTTATTLLLDISTRDI
jgi:hypothetical protein